LLWTCYGKLYFYNDLATRIQIKFIAPTNATTKNNYLQNYNTINNVFSSSNTIFSNFVAPNGDVSGGLFFYLDGIVYSGDGGLFKLQWTQVTAVAGNTTVKAGSYLEMIKQ
jgi:hypothetical protein